MHEITYTIFPSENFLDLSLYQFGWERCEPGHSFGPATRNHYLFHYIISGHGTLLADDAAGQTRRFDLHAGQGFLIFPGQINTYYADREEPWEYTWLEFDGLRVKLALELMDLSPDRPVYRPRDSALRDGMRDEMLYIAHHGDESPLHLIGHLYLFLDLFYRSVAVHRQQGGNKLREAYVREAIAYIENNYQNDVSVESMADTIGINRSYFGKIFKQQVGMSPQKFLMQYRMVKATELLALTQRPVNEIGAAVGYPNQMHFSRAFRGVYGLSPREWKKKNAAPAVDF